MRSNVVAVAAAVYLASMAETFFLAWERDAQGIGAELEDWAIEQC